MLRTGSVTDIKIQNPNTSNTCETCIAGKMTTTPFKRLERTSKQPLELIHTDVCGPMRTNSLGGAKYFVTFIDDYSRMSHVCFMKQKSEVINKYNQFKELVKNQTGYKIKALQSDNGREYVNQAMIETLRKHGIHHRMTIPHTPQQNGAAERKNRTLIEAARCMMLESVLPPSL